VLLQVLKESLSKEEVHAFMREAAIMAQLRHPNVVSLVGVCTAGEPKMLVMQLCEYGSLLSFLLQHVGFNELQFSSKLRIMGDVSRGMHFLSSLNIVHRDLAARNVLVGADYICKVSGFVSLKTWFYAYSWIVICRLQISGWPERLQMRRPIITRHL
jgi:serine/threonine protein kinase